MIGPDKLADTEFTKWLITLGVGGVLAGFMFMFYRKDIKQYTELWKTQAELNRQQLENMMLVVKENTTSNVKLVTMIEAQERNALRKSDIEFLIAQQIRGKIIEGKGVIEPKP